MRLSKSENHSPNYLATVVMLDNLKDHPGADRLEIVELFGGNVIVGKGIYSLGETLVYFPIESSLDAEFLSWANLFDENTLNADGVTKSFFQAKGRRVKPLKLRGIPSEGFLYPANKLAEFCKVDVSIFKIGESFDQIGEKVILEKWISGGKQNEPVEKKVKIPAWIQKLPRPIRKFIGNRFYSARDEGIKSAIVAGQFNFHYDTNNLGKSHFVVKPDDQITISDKWHGTSAVFANVLCYRQRKWWEKAIGVPFEKLSKEYKLIYSSRSVIKNRKDGKWTNDPWGRWAEIVESKGIPDGVTIYSEIVGYVNSGKMIQKNYDYGYTPGQNGMHIYRISHTDGAGKINEFSFEEILDFCATYDLKATPVLYQGKAGKLFPEIPNDENWSKEFVKKLGEKYLEKNCEFCKTKVPAEGVVLKLESKEGRPVFKHKSFAFKSKESAERDKGESNLEEES
jgi:hypothetical protein